MHERIFAGAGEVGRDPDEITCVYSIEVSVGERPDPRPFAVSGSPEAVAEQLVDFLALGFTSMNFTLLGRDRSEKTRRLAHEVIPAVRAAASTRGLVATWTTNHRLTLTSPGRLDLWFDSVDSYAWGSYGLGGRF